MPKYNAWIPVVAHVLVSLETDEPLTRKELRNTRELAERFIDEGETAISCLCDDCETGIRLDLSDIEPELKQGDTLDVAEAGDSD